MKIKDIMTQDVKVIRPDATLKDAAQEMKNLDVGALPVCDGNRLIGMITDRDITVRGTAEGRDPQNTKVSDVLTSTEVLFCYEDQTVKDAAQMMRDNQIRRLPIVNRAKQLVGIVSLGDLAVQSDKEKMVGNTLEAVSQPDKPNTRQKDARL